jgi:hypothetical protein
MAARTTHGLRGAGPAPSRASSLTGRRWRRRFGDRGSVAVEAAIIFPLLITLTFGIIEFALLMRDHTATSSLVRAGARTASALPRDPAMVVSTVEAMERAGSALPQSSYEELWIYRANAAGYPGGPSNRDFSAGSCTSNCVRYSWNEAGDEFRQVSGSWSPTSINACAGDPGAQAVGVYLKANHEWITGLFFDTTFVADRAVLKFEPIATLSSAVPCK